MGFICQNSHEYQKSAMSVVQAANIACYRYPCSQSWRLFTQKACCCHAFKGIVVAAVQFRACFDSGLQSRALLLQDDGVAEQLQQAADRAQKWKQRCAKLRQELMETQTAAASLEAALNVS